MAQSNQPFKRPNLAENEDYTKIPPPSGQESTFVPGKSLGAPSVLPNLNPVTAPVVALPPSQEEINWAIQLEESVQKKGYKPTELEMSRYQEIANKIVAFQQSQAHFNNVPLPPRIDVQQAPVYKKKKSGIFSKLFMLFIFFIIFWAKLSLVILEPSYFVPKGKIYVVVKPINFSSLYFNLNMDKVYDDKIRKGFTKEDFFIEKTKYSKKKAPKKVNENWYLDPQYWEDNYLLVLPYPNLKFNL